MKLKTSELTDLALDWAVAMTEGYDESWLLRQLANPNPKTRAIIRFIEDWAEAGPIIEREQLGVWFSQAMEDENGTPLRTATWYAEDLIGFTAVGPTPLVAAMRCYVASKLGDEIDVPEKLL